MSCQFDRPRQTQHPLLYFLTPDLKLITTMNDTALCYLDFHKEHEVKLHSGAGVGMARVAQFILGQTDIQDCVPFLINCANVI